MATPTGSPVRTSSSYSRFEPPSAPNQRQERDIEAMNDLIDTIKKKDYHDSVLTTFKKKLNSGYTKPQSRLNQNPTNRVFIDDKTQKPRLVYKIAFNSVIEREIGVYKVLEKKDPELKHILNRQSDHIRLDRKFGMFITEYKEGLESRNLIWPNITKAENEKNNDEHKRLLALVQNANEYLEKAGVEHGDIAGNLYEVNRDFVWIDFEQSIIKDFEQSITKGKKSWFSSLSPFSSPQKKSQGLFGDSDDEESPPKRPRALFSDENDENDNINRTLFNGGKSRNKKSHKTHKRKTNKRRIRKYKSRKLKSRK